MGSTLTLTSCTFYDNTAASADSLRMDDAAAEVTNTIFWGATTNQIGLTNGGSATLAHSVIRGGWSTGTNVLDADPLFVDAATGDLHLQPGSPCIDAANGDVAPGLDLDGNPRVDATTITDTGTGTPTYVDVGAYEYQP